MSMTPKDTPDRVVAILHERLMAISECVGKHKLGTIEHARVTAAYNEASGALQAVTLALSGTPGRVAQIVAWLRE